MPAGYVQTADPNDVARAVLGKSTWAVLALTLDIELFVQAHYRASIEPQDDLSELWKDVFLFHWKEESQHAILDEMELRSEDAKLDAAQRYAAVDDLIALVGAVDGILQAQAEADAGYFVLAAGTPFTDAQREQIHEKVLKAYRWQYIVSGVMEPRFQKVLFGLIDESQADAHQERAGAADLRHSGAARSNPCRSRPEGESHVLCDSVQARRPGSATAPRGASSPACAARCARCGANWSAPGATAWRDASSHSSTRAPCATSA